MSKGRCLTKRKYGDFRKSRNWKDRFKYLKFPRNLKLIKRFEGMLLPMKRPYQ